jgi:hypothetical protein
VSDCYDCGVIPCECAAVFARCRAERLARAANVRTTRSVLRVAVLFASARGNYSDPELAVADALDGGLDLWDERRDARLYDGDAPVVAHPPCARWCQLAGLVEARYGYKRGEDAGCFASALANVRRCGGVLEHPAYSLAWKAFDLPMPPRTGGWQRGLCGGWSTHVEQRAYGHRARKATWLYVHSADLRQLRWGATEAPEATVSWCANNRPSGLPRTTRREASATPIEFTRTLITLAISAGLNRKDARRAA